MATTSPTACGSRFQQCWMVGMASSISSRPPRDPEGSHVPRRADRVPSWMNHRFGWRSWTTSVVSHSWENQEADGSTGPPKVAATATVRVTLRVYDRRGRLCSSSHEVTGHGNAGDSVTLAEAVQRSLKQSVTNAKRDACLQFASPKGREGHES